MPPGTITAVAYLISELVLAGVEMSALLAEIKATGKLSDAQWQKILDDLAAAKAAWDSA